MKIIRSFLVFISVMAIGTIYSCSKTNGGSNALYVPTSANVTANATLQELQQGRALYISKCNACHDLVSPENYSPTQWKSIIATMAPRTNLTPAETALVTKYVSKGNQ